MECPIKIDPYIIRNASSSKINEIIVNRISNSSNMEFIRCIFNSLFELMKSNKDSEYLIDNDKFLHLARIKRRDYFFGDKKIDIIDFLNGVDTIVYSGDFSYDIYYIYKSINDLRFKIPTFLYTFSLFELKQKDKIAKCIVSEYIKGITLQEFISQPNFERNKDNINDLLNIIIQILFALEIAQKNYNFMHFNLNPSNIILIPTNHIHYDVILDNLTYRIQCYKYIACIINYNKSSITSKKFGYLRGVIDTNDSLLKNCIPGYDIYYLSTFLRKSITNFYTYEYTFNTNSLSVNNKDSKNPLSYINWLFVKYPKDVGQNINILSKTEFLPINTYSYEYLFKQIFNITFNDSTRIANCFIKNDITDSFILINIAIKYKLSYHLDTSDLIDNIKKNKFFMIRNDLKMLLQFKLIESIPYDIYDMCNIINQLSISDLYKFRDKNIKEYAQTNKNLDIYDTIIANINYINYYYKIYINTLDYVCIYNIIQSLHLVDEYGVFINEYNNSKQLNNLQFQNILETTFRYCKIILEIINFKPN